MTRDAFIQELLKAAKKAGIAEAEAYFQQKDAFKVMIHKGEIDDYSVNVSGGLSLRGLVGGKMGTAYTEALDEAAIEMLVSNVLQSAALINDPDEQFIFGGSKAYEKVDSQGDLGAVPERLDLALALDRVGRSTDPRVQELSYCMFQTEHQSVRLVNTRGLDLSHESDICMGFVQAVAREGDRVTTGASGKAGRALGALDAALIAKEAVDEAVFQLSASPCESGTVPVIIRNSAMVDFLDVFSGVFSADAAQKGMSLLKGKEGETIAAPCVTLTDDPLKKGGSATRPFDAEGVATYTKNIVENGVLETLLHNLKTAKKAGCESTGNAARAGYAGAVTVAPSNFSLKPGDKSLETLCREMNGGIVVTVVDGLHAGADTVSGDFSLLAKGYLVEGGEPGRAVEQVTVAGNFFQLLKDIVAVGNDARTYDGATESPSVWVKALSVAGK